RSCTSSCGCSTRRIRRRCSRWLSTIRRCSANIRPSTLACGREGGTVNWKLILQLSLFGLAMAFATVYVIPSSVEPFLWLPIFVLCAWLIAKRAPGKVFLHGLLLGIMNSIWITAAHVLLFDAYMAHHAREAAMMQSVQMPAAPRVMMLIIGPCVGVVSGIVIGLFAMVAAWLGRHGVKAAPAA